MTVGIIGLGLIGGSLAKAFQRDESVTVLGWDADHSIVEFAEIAQAIDGELTDEKLQGLDLLLLATYPEAVVQHMTIIACSPLKCSVRTSFHELRYSRSTLPTRQF